MAITLRETLQGTAVGANLQLTTGAGTLATDVLLVTHSTHFYTLADMDPPTPGSWTLVASADDGTDRVKIKLWGRVAGSAGAQTITLPPVNDTHTFGRLRVLGGADNSDPFDAAAGANGFSVSSQQSAPSVSPDSADAFLCCDWVCDSELTYSPPAGMTASGTQEQDFSTAYGAHQQLSAAGATGVRTATLTGDASFAATSVAVRTGASAVNLTVADATHQHTVDNLTLAQVHQLAVADATHAQTADNLVLTQVHQLVVADATHQQAADGLTLTQSHQLVVADATHQQHADQVTLTSGGTEPAPSEQTYVVPAENRRYVVPAESRIHLLPAESRTYAVPTEDRTYEVSA